jgi:hypothetical protein
MGRTKAFALCAVALIGSLSITMASAKEKSHQHHQPADVTSDRGLRDYYGYPSEFGYVPEYLGYNGYFGGPALYGAYHGDGSCYFVRHRVWTPHGWRLHPVQICG